MNPVTILMISGLIGAAAIAVLLAVVCIRYEKYHPEDIDQWEDISDVGSDVGEGGGENG